MGHGSAHDSEEGDVGLRLPSKEKDPKLGFSTRPDPDDLPNLPGQFSGPSGPWTPDSVTDLVGAPPTPGRDGLPEMTPPGMGLPPLPDGVDLPFESLLDQFGGKDGDKGPKPPKPPKDETKPPKPDDKPYEPKPRKMEKPDIPKPDKKDKEPKEPEAKEPEAKEPKPKEPKPKDPEPKDPEPKKPEVDGETGRSEVPGAGGDLTIGGGLLDHPNSDGNPFDDPVTNFGNPKHRPEGPDTSDPEDAIRDRNPVPDDPRGGDGHEHVPTRGYDPSTLTAGGAIVDERNTNTGNPDHQPERPETDKKSPPPNPNGERSHYNEIAEAGGLHPKIDPMQGVGLGSQLEPSFEQNDDQLPSLVIPGLDDFDAVASVDVPSVHVPSLDDGSSTIIGTRLTWLDDDDTNRFMSGMEIDNAIIDDGRPDDLAGPAGP